MIEGGDTPLKTSVTLENHDFLIGDAPFQNVSWTSNKNHQTREGDLLRRPEVGQWTGDQQG